MTYLGEKIKRHRQEKGYSLGKLAELTDTSKSYLWDIETRDTCKPSGEKLARIAEALSVTTDYLLDEAAEPGNEVLREAFFRKFNKLEEEDQKKIEQMVDLWGRKDTEYISGAAGCGRMSDFIKAITDAKPQGKNPRAYVNTRNVVAPQLGTVAGIDVYADNSVPEGVTRLVSDGVVIAEVSFEGSVILRPNEN